MKNRTWKNIPLDSSETIREILLSQGGRQDQEVKGQSEAWRIRVEDVVFTLYKTGTLYFSGGASDATKVALEHIASILEKPAVESEKDFLVGMDETGKGEVLGPSVLAVVVVAKNLGPRIDSELGSADTK